MVTSGATTPGTNTTGEKSVTLNGSTGYTLSAGSSYYVVLGYTYSSGTGVAIAAGVSGQGANWSLFGTGVGSYESYSNSTTGIPPASITTSATVNLQVMFALLTT